MEDSLHLLAGFLLGSLLLARDWFSDQAFRFIKPLRQETSEVSGKAVPWVLLLAGLLAAWWW